MYIFLSRFCLYFNGTHLGSRRTRRTLLGISMHWGNDQGAWRLQRVSYRCAHHVRDTTHERDRTIEHRLCCYSKAELQPLLFDTICVILAQLCAMHVILNTCGTTSTVSLTPLIMACQSRTVCSTWRGPVCTGHKQRLMSYAKRGVPDVQTNTQLSRLSR